MYLLLDIFDNLVVVESYTHIDNSSLNIIVPSAYRIINDSLLFKPTTK